MTDSVILGLDDPEFDRLFERVERSWFRLETLQRYDVDYEREPFARFLRGEPLDIDSGDYEELVRGHVAAGRRLARVHVIEEPHNDYIRYELAAYRLNVDAGEDVRVIPVGSGDWPEGVPRHDYWLFDDRNLWLMHYDAGGAFTGAELVEDSVAIERHQRWWDAALAQSISLAEYMDALQRTS